MHLRVVAATVLAAAAVLAGTASVASLESAGHATPTHVVLASEKTHVFQPHGHASTGRHQI